MLKKIIPLFAVVLLAACAHGPCQGNAGAPCKCAGQSTCQCKEAGKCTHCAEKAKAEKKEGDCPKCRESERLDEERRYN